jgi:membrane fusion protein (multidrug efflux system)
VILRIVFPNPEGVLLPGMFIRAVVKEGISEQAILIPQQSVSRDPKGNPMTMLVNAENKAEQVRLILDRSVEDKWFVTSGLKAGDRVIVEGLQRVRPGVPVRIAEPKPAGNPQSPAKAAN